MSFGEVITIILTIPICIVAVAIILPIAYPELTGICAIIACTISLIYVTGFIIIWHFGSKNPGVIV